MTTQEALSIVAQASRGIQANAETHEKINEALVHLAKELAPNEEKSEKVAEKSKKM